MSEIIENIHRYIEFNNMFDGCGEVVVGLSGGADSVCLLHVLKSYVDKYKCNMQIKAVHVNHGIRQEAARDEKFAKELCERLGVDFAAYHIVAEEIADRDGIGVEEAGRRERYRIFEEECAKAEADWRSQEGLSARIAVAHHMNDQAETVLMNMARGASLKGMGGMRPVRGRIVRPLLCVTRQEVETVLGELGQAYVTDATNMCNDYTRNSVRNIVLPGLTANVNVNAVRNIARTAHVLQDSFDYIESEADRAYEKYVRRDGDSAVIYFEGAPEENFEKNMMLRNDGISNENMDLGKNEDLEEGFFKLHDIIRTRVIYKAIISLTGAAKDIYEVHIDAVDSLTGKQVGSMADICYGLRAIRGYDRIMIGRHITHLNMQEDLRGAAEQVVPDSIGEDKNFRSKLKEAATEVMLTPGEPVTFGKNIYAADLGKCLPAGITCELSTNYEKNRNYADSSFAKVFDYDKIHGKICLRFRNDGDRIVVGREGQTRKLKKELIDRKVPESVRDKVLLVCDDEGVLWACGIRRCERALIDDDTRRVLRIHVQFTCDCDT